MGLFGDLINHPYKTLNDARVNNRGSLANMINAFGGAHDMMDEGDDLHRKTARSMTSVIGDYLPPRVSAGITDLAGLANETVSGGLQKGILGKPFYSDAGFDYGDIAHNREGEDQGIEDLEKKPLTTRSFLIKALQNATGWGLAEQGLKGIDWLSKR